MPSRRELLRVFAGLVAGTAAGSAAVAEAQPHAPPAAPASGPVPPFVQRGQPGPFHAALEPLVGSWQVDKEIYIAVGSPKEPARSSGMTARRSWFGGGRHLLDITEGGLGSSSYYRLGVLGFSGIDRCYEWVTFDALNANLMLYRSALLQAPAPAIEMRGVFTDQGLLGERFAGRRVAMRTLLQIEDRDHHRIDLYFTPPGGREILIDRSLYRRG